MATVTWVKCGTGANWCPLQTLDMASISGTPIGVYVIWHEGTPSRVVRVGQGNIVDRLSVHRNDDKITKYRSFGTLRVTWASVPKKADRDGIERYLANHYGPLVGDAWPDVVPIAVNLPGS